MLSINTKIVGSTFVDGQKHFSSLTMGDRLVIKRDLENPVDKNAVGVYLETGEMLGYLKADLSVEISLLLDRGDQFDVLVTAITGLEYGKERAGCNILICKKQRS